MLGHVAAGGNEVNSDQQLNDFSDPITVKKKPPHLGGLGTRRTSAQRLKGIPMILTAKFMPIFLCFWAELF